MSFSHNLKPILMRLQVFYALSREVGFGCFLNLWAVLAEHAARFLLN